MAQGLSRAWGAAKSGLAGFQLVVSLAADADQFRDLGHADEVVGHGGDLAVLPIARQNPTAVRS